MPQNRHETPSFVKRHKNALLATTAVVGIVTVLAWPSEHQKSPQPPKQGITTPSPTLFPTRETRPIPQILTTQSAEATLFPQQEMNRYAVIDSAYAAIASLPSNFQTAETKKKAADTKLEGTHNVMKVSSNSIFRQSDKSLFQEVNQNLVDVSVLENISEFLKTEKEYDAVTFSTNNNGIIQIHIIFQRDFVLNTPSGILATYFVHEQEHAGRALKLFNELGNLSVDEKLDRADDIEKDPAALLTEEVIAYQKQIESYRMLKSLGYPIIDLYLENINMALIRAEQAQNMNIFRDYMRTFLETIDAK